ncbi:MAG: aromatic amino acid lyase, partial [Candidatus Dormibacteraceae bacterium]
MVRLDGSSLTFDEVRQVARQGAPAELTDDARQRVESSWGRLQGLVDAGTPVYGLTTGFGALDGRPIPHELNRAQQRNLLMSHSAGVG